MYIARIPKWRYTRRNLLVIGNGVAVVVIVVHNLNAHVFHLNIVGAGNGLKSGVVVAVVVIILPHLSSQVHDIIILGAGSRLRNGVVAAASVVDRIFFINFFANAATPSFFRKCFDLYPEDEFLQSTLFIVLLSLLFDIYK